MYFNRSKKHISLEKFIDDNPVLGEVNNFKMQQKCETDMEYEMVFDLHELTLYDDEPGKETQPYINYICAVL